MTAFDEFRSDMNAYRLAMDEEARSLRDSQRVVEKLRRFYERLTPEEQKLADQVLVEWVLAELPPDEADNIRRMRRRTRLVSQRGLQSAA